MRLVVLAIVTVLSATGSPAADTARQILDRRKALDDGERRWRDREQQLALTIVDKRGGERRRRLRLFERRQAGEETRSILFFLEPAEVAGTAFLSFTHTGRAADQWLYLPELQRIRQITAQTRRERFVGTDLSYHDLDLIQEMVSWTESDAASRLRGEEPIDGGATWAIELEPRRDDIGYRRIVLWLGQADLVPRQLELFDEGTQPTKRIRQSDVRPVGAIPVAHGIEVTTPAAGSRTTIVVEHMRFDQDLDDGLFTQRALERGVP